MTEEMKILNFLLPIKGAHFENLIVEKEKILNPKESLWAGIFVLLMSLFVEYLFKMPVYYCILFLSPVLICFCGLAYCLFSNKSRITAIKNIYFSSVLGVFQLGYFGASLLIHLSLKNTHYNFGSCSLLLLCYLLASFLAAFIGYHFYYIQNKRRKDIRVKKFSNIWMVIGVIAGSRFGKIARNSNINLNFAYFAAYMAYFFIISVSLFEYRRVCYYYHLLAQGEMVENVEETEQL